MSEIAEKVKAIIVDKLGVEESEVVTEASFTNDLGADSLDTVELIMEFEKEFDISIPDDQAEKIQTVGEAVFEMSEGFNGLVVTTGGTGFGPRDLSPEGTRMVLDREAPGFAEAMRAVNPLGRLSRAVAGTRGQALVVNTPGSTSGAIECLEAILDVIPHAIRLLAGD